MDEGGAGEEITHEPVQVVARVCAIDIGKAALVACVRVLHASRPDRRVQQVREYATVTPALLALADWLRVELVAMEAASTTGSRCPICWRPKACWRRNFDLARRVVARDLDERSMRQCSTVAGTVSVMFRWLFQRIERIVDWAARREVRKRDEIRQERDRY